MNRLYLLCICAALFHGCGSEGERTTPTSGSALIYTAPSVEALSIELGRTFEQFYPDARIDFSVIPTQNAIDSLLNGTRQEIILDRTLSAAESLAFVQHGVPLYQYRIASLPLFIAVHPSNTVQAIDSAAVYRLLSGTVHNWDELGGPDLPCTIYLPQPGEGGWEVCKQHFKSLEIGAAHICSTQTDLIARAEADPGALAIVSIPLARTALRKLWWRQGAVEIPPNIKTIAEAPHYPLKLDITYVTNRQKMDVAAGFLTFIVSNNGQKIVADHGYRPATIPVRIIETY